MTMTRDELLAEQRRIASLEPPAWRPPEAGIDAGGCFVAFQRGIAGRGRRGDRCWAGAAVWRNGRLSGQTVLAGTAGARYEPGLLFLREGPLLLAAIRELPALPAVLLVNGTGRDHPRGAGLAVHLGMVLDLPTIGITDRPLLAVGREPGPESGSTAPLILEGKLVGYSLRPCTGVRSLVIHAGWRTGPDLALAVARGTLRRARTPEPIRLARELARRARAAAATPP
jgi:deoxyribonuclease V